MIEDLILKSRSYRRFHQDVAVPRSDLEELIGLARLSPTGGNIQPLKYFLSTENKTNAKIYPCLEWAGYITDWDGPEEGERPSAYIVILLDLSIAKHAGVDHGIASQSILLGAAAKGWGGCIIKSVARSRLQEDLNLPSQHEILLVLALGKPKEQVVLDDVEGGDIKYWRDENGVHHVPKRSLSELIIN